MQPLSAAVPILTKAISQIESQDGWVRMDFIGSQLTNMASDFDVRTYGFSKLSGLVRKTGMFDLERAEGGHMRVRPKPKAKGSRKK